MRLLHGAFSKNCGTAATVPRKSSNDKKVSFVLQVITADCQRNAAGEHTGYKYVIAIFSCRGVESLSAHMARTPAAPRPLEQFPA
jgi:hypothetical protein